MQSYNVILFWYCTPGERPFMSRFRINQWYVCPCVALELSAFALNIRCNVECNCDAI
jgi:hypothetical protein